MELPRITVSEALAKKWTPILEHKNFPKINDSYRKIVTTVLLENQWLDQQAQRNRGLLFEDAPNNTIGNAGSGRFAQNGSIATWDPVLISLVRRAMPNLVAYDICGVQAMNAPTGLIFALRSNYNTQNDLEALGLDEPYTRFSGTSSAITGGATSAGLSSNPFENGITSTFGGYSGLTAFPGMNTSGGEGLGYGDNNQFPEMAMSIDKIAVEARTRALKAEYTMELEQDLKAVHGLDAQTELANILSAEIMAEINREVVRTVYNVAQLGCLRTTTRGIFNVKVDSPGRWMAEQWKGLLFQITREANAIAKLTRRGKGNIVITTSDVADALGQAGVIDYTPALQANLNVDDTGNTFAGTLSNGMKVYIDPYASLVSGEDYVVVGYKGSGPFDAGMFYCPYVPLQMVRAVGQDSFQPKIAFKTRYGLVNNPFVRGTDGVPIADPTSTSSKNANQYYRKFKVTNLM